MALPKLHRDPAVYGEDTEDWKPERMLDESFSKLQPNSWKPSATAQEDVLADRLPGRKPFL